MECSSVNEDRGAHPSVESKTQIRNREQIGLPQMGGGGWPTWAKGFPGPGVVEDVCKATTLLH